MYVIIAVSAKPVIEPTMHSGLEGGSGERGWREGGRIYSTIRKPCVSLLSYFSLVLENIT